MKKYVNNYCGRKVSEYAWQNGYVDYATLADCFDGVLCNNITEVDPDIWENVESGELYGYYMEDAKQDYNTYVSECKQDKQEVEEFEQWFEDNSYKYEFMQEVYQYYLVSNNALDYLKDANELVLYSEKLDCYVWCVTHYGTAWSYVLTSIKLEELE